MTNSCHLCSQEFSADDLVEINGFTTCAQCKPTLLQQLQEGVAVGGIYRKGKLAVKGLDTTMPKRCFKCNSENNLEHRAKTLWWTPTGSIPSVASIHVHRSFRGRWPLVPCSSSRS